MGMKKFPLAGTSTRKFMDERNRVISLHKQHPEFTQATPGQHLQKNVLEIPVWQ